MLVDLPDETDRMEGERDGLTVKTEGERGALAAEVEEEAAVATDDGARDWFRV